MAQLTADWNPLGRDIFYRKFELYSMAWSDLIEFNDYIITPAAFGGPIAVIPDDKKLLKLPNPSMRPGKPVIFIFSSSGKLLSNIKWSSGKILKLGWSNTEDLLVVQDDGVVLMYDIFGQFKKTIGMGQEARETKVLDCKIFDSHSGTGVAVLTTAYRIFLFDNVENPRIRMLKDLPGLNSLPNCWTVLSEDRTTEVLLVQENEVFVISSSCEIIKKTPDFTIAPSNIIEMALSCNNKHLALLTDNNILWIGSADVEKRYCEFNTKLPSRPQQVVWCGSNAVVINWENLLMVIGLNGTSINYYLDSSVCVCPEIDGVRLIGNQSHEFLQKVPSVVASIFMIGSMAPGAILLEASKEFQKKSHRADDYLRTIKDQLEDAITQCIQAAGHEYLPSTQKMLLRAASFGKCFMPTLDPEEFVKMCKNLRVLNAVRDHALGIPLTYVQLEQLTVNVLVDRLVLRRHYYLGIKVCQYLRIPDAQGASKILSHWAKYKVMQPHMDEDQLAREIAEKVGAITGVSYSDIALDASNGGKKQLATKLLDYEPRASEQVPLLLTLKEYQPAVSKAIESGDTDLIFSVILELHGVLSRTEFLKTIGKFPVANTLYLKYCRTENLEELSELYYQEDNFQAQGHIHVIESYQKTAVDQRLAELQAVLEAYRKSRNDFLINQTEDQIRLLRNQRSLSEKFSNTAYIGKSLHETLRILLHENQIKLAEELRKTFKVSDKRYCWTKVQAFAELGEWSEIEKIGKKSPIGYEPLVDACMKKHNSHEAQKYLPKVLSANKIKYYVKAGCLEEASVIALEQKDEHGLNYIQSKCGPSNDALRNRIQSMKLQIASKR